MTDAAHARLDASMRRVEPELIELHRALVRVPSINRGDGSSARETEVARVAADYLRERGIAARIVESAPGRGNLLAEWSPSGRGRSLLMMSHADVVPAGEERAWTHPPFSGELAEGRIWGRGSNDCKMMAACELFTLATLKREGLLKGGAIRIAMGADEEAGGRYGFGWLTDHEADFLRADLAVNEGGGSSLGELPGGARAIGVGCGEKGRYDVVFTARGAGGHASTPWGKGNPVAAIGRLAARIGEFEGEAGPASPIFDALKTALELGDAESIEAVASAAEARWPACANSLRAQRRLTLVPTMTLAGEKSNAIPTSARLTCDARILPGQTLADLETLLARLLEGCGDIETEIIETAEPSVSPMPESMRDLFAGAAARAMRGRSERDSSDERPSVEALPTWCTGFTDSRFVRRLGVPTYGFQLVDSRADPALLGIHCVDESIDVRMLLTCARALGHLALSFCGGETPDLHR